MTDDHITKNYYEILDVSCDVDPEALKRAYRRMVKKHHPDRQPENVQAEERFKELQEAYDVLKDPERRNQYDVLYLRNKAGSRGRRDNQKGKGDKSGVSEVVEDVFEFLKSRMKDRGKRGEDLRYLLTLSFEEAAAGIKKVIRIPKRKSCPVCAGRGWHTPGQTPVCQTCSGQGEITSSKGKTRELVPCPECDGKGLHEKKPCKRCRGEGTIPYRVQRTVTIPAGVDNGVRLKIRGEGAAGERGGEKGDLYIVIQVKDHPFFKRNHLDVLCDLPIHFTQAVLGAEVMVSTLKGESALTIPPGTQSGEVFTLKGYGIPGLNGTKRGDQKIHIRVQVPRKISKKEKEILKTWEALQKK